MPKFTPGPWGRNIPPASKYPVIYAGRNTHVAQVVSAGLPLEQVEANADLIAAGPMMYAALLEAEVLLKEYPIVERQVKAALARAEGKE